MFNREVLPKIYKFIEISSNDSHLKDVGSAYRSSHAYRTQLAALSSLRTLAVDLRLEDGPLERAMSCVRPYLSNRQPKPLQELAVQFFREILKYDWGAAWHHLRVLCDNQLTLEPPALDTYDLAPITGTPFEPSDAKYKNNINAIFGVK
ncbi:TELO2-interacting protein 1 homolog [Eumeta japonica]|uniref:TELO2-interacting protein 1 homolog n=1 Tax=Eumeta variegata TaxID=151549 RepID=A0A4C1ZQE1_EUMVA|nr:TELO2-interacting protein 1 homolog [Eumeta japonica]